MPFRKVSHRPHYWFLGLSKPKVVTRSQDYAFGLRRRSSEGRKLKSVGAGHHFRNDRYLDMSLDNPSQSRR